MTTVNNTSAEIAESLRRQIGECQTRRDALAAEGQTILTRNAATGALDGDDRTRFEAIEAELGGLKTRSEGYAKMLGHVERGVGLEGGIPAAPAPSRPRTPADSMDDDARRAIESAHTRGLLPDHAAKRAERLLTASAGDDRSTVARWLAVAGSDAYTRAFATLAGDPVRGHLLWSPEEQEAFRRADALRRDMAIGTGSAGGYMVPTILDPAILLSSDGSTSPLRRIARVETIGTSAWNGVTSAGATAEWKTEGASAADASPTIAAAPVPVHLGDAFVPYSFEVGQDAADFLTQLQVVLVDAADQLMAAAYATGSGSGQPTGVVTGLASGQKIAAATADEIVAADVTGVQNGLPPRFQANAQFCANLTTINEIGSMETSNGALRFPEVGSGRLLRKPLNELSALDAAGDTASAGNDHVLLYGDFRQFLIVDRIGTTLELVQNLADPDTGRPTGERGALLWFRTGANVLVPNAFRLLTT
jgi:HK97 family phage major capsid protein